MTSDYHTELDCLPFSLIIFIFFFNSLPSYEENGRLVYTRSQCRLISMTGIHLLITVTWSDTLSIHRWSRKPITDVWYIDLYVGIVVYIYLDRDKNCSYDCKLTFSRHDSLRVPGKIKCLMFSEHKVGLHLVKTWIGSSFLRFSSPTKPLNSMWGQSKGRKCLHVVYFIGDISFFVI